MTRYKGEVFREWSRIKTGDSDLCEFRPVFACSSLFYDYLG